jgi:hypothetical protein
MSYRKSLGKSLGIISRAVLAAATLTFAAGVAQPVLAQLALPGAMAPAPAGTVASPAQQLKKKTPRPAGEGGDEARGPAIAPKLPSEDTIVGKPLYLDGARSSIVFEHSGAELRVAKLSLAGDRLSRSGEDCRIEVAGSPLKLSPRDSDAGLHRYQVEFPACPFTFDVLDGAILAANEGKACELKEADCHTDPAGLWGMGATEFDPKHSKDMLGTRARVEKTVRSDFRVLYDRNKADKALRKLLVREQAGFSSRREEICRNYAQESDYGYCALRVTEARALALGAQLAHGVKRPPGLEPAAEEEKPRKKGKGRR